MADKLKALLCAVGAATVPALALYYPLYLMHGFAGPAPGAARMAFSDVAYVFWFVATLVFVITIVVLRIYHKGRIVRFSLFASSIVAVFVCWCLWMNLRSGNADVSSYGEAYRWGWPSTVYFREVGRSGYASCSWLWLYLVLNAVLLGATALFVYLVVCPTPSRPHPTPRGGPASADSAAPSEPRPRIVAGLPGRLDVATGLFLFTGLLVVSYVACLKPYRQVREALSAVRTADGAATEMRSRARAEIEELGGSRAAAGKLADYCRLPRTLAPDRQHAVMLLGFCGDYAVPHLAWLLVTSENELRTATAQAFVQVGSPAAVDGLISIVNEVGQENSLLLAIGALGDLGNERAVPALEALIARDYNQDRKDSEAARKALRKLRSGAKENQSD